MQAIDSVELITLQELARGHMVPPSDKAIVVKLSDAGLVRGSPGDLRITPQGRRTLELWRDSH